MAGESIGGSRYEEALHYLYGFIDYEKNAAWTYDRRHFDLNRLRRYLEGLGSPQERFTSVHIAGTNGKGSVAAMIERVLRESGFRTGLYTSPHLVTFRERIAVNGGMISRDAVVCAVDRLRSSEVSPGGLTFFDVWTALAFDVFAREHVDIAVVEVGMGGRLDSTNVVTPAVSAITAISMDHRGKLGDSLADITAEKAGIIKPGVPVVVMRQPPEADEVIRRKAAETGSVVVDEGGAYTWRRDGKGLYYRGADWNIGGIRLSLPGDYQYRNAACAVAVLEQLAKSGLAIAPESVAVGMADVSWPGRLQTIAEHPAVILDGAANPGAMQEVVSQLAAAGDRETTVAVVSMCRDKEVREVLDILSRAVSTMIFTGTDNPRSCQPEELLAHAPPEVQTLCVEDPAGAVRQARGIAGSGGRVIVTGSLYLVGAVAAARLPV